MRCRLIVGVDEVGEMGSELAVAVVVIALGGRPLIVRFIALDLPIGEAARISPMAVAALAAIFLV
jgi:hypothetical protein